MLTVQRGNAAEGAVFAALLRAGIPALLPFGQGLPFDLAAIVPPYGEAVRIQVKSGRVRNGCIHFNTCSTDHGRGRQPYRGLADLIAVHIPDPDRVFMIPVDECPSYTGCLRLDQPRNNQRRRIRLAADHEFESWVRALGPRLG